MRTMTLAGLLLLMAWLQGCASHNPLVNIPCHLAGPKICGALSEVNAQTVAQGTIYDSPYTIKKLSTGAFMLNSPSMQQPTLLTQATAIRKVQAFRGQSSTIDILEAPSADCPYRYMAVIGGKSRVRTANFGCQAALQFTAGKDHNSVFGTESSDDGVNTPWTYRITDTGVADPRALSAYSQHQDYNFYRDRERGISRGNAAAEAAARRAAQQAEQQAARQARRPQSTPGAAPSPAPASPQPTQPAVARPDTAPAVPYQTASQTADAAASPATPRRRSLPPPEKPVLPGEVEAKAAVYDKPSVSFGQ